MKKNRDEKIKNKEQKKVEKTELFIKIMAGVLAVLMVFSVAVSLIYALI